MKKNYIVIGIIVFMLLVALGIQTNRVERGKTAYAQLEFKCTSYQKEQADKLIQMNQEHLAKIEEMEREAENEKIKRDADIDSLNATINRVRSEADTRIRDAYHSALAKGCTTEGDFILLQRQLYEELRDFARGTAQEVDERKAAGLMCERIYEEMRKN